MAKKKYYAVKNGKKPGIYETWDDCKANVHGFANAIYKSFPTREEAEAYMGNASGQASAAGAQKEEEPVQAVAYVDGSYNRGTGEYSCGIVFRYDGKEEQISLKGERPELSEMNNVAGEIFGAEMAMKRALELGLTSIAIYHDYQGIASWCLGEWKTNKEGTRAYKAYYDSICDKLKVVFRKVKGHSGDEGNELADQLAKRALGLFTNMM